MHIAVLTDGITPFVTGGMQRHSFHLVKNLLKKGIRVTLVHCIFDDNSFPRKEDVYELLEATPDQLVVHTLRFPSTRQLPGHYLKESYRYSCDIYDLLKEKWGEFDFIYAKGYTAWCLLEKKKRGKHMAPVGVKFHGYEMFQKTSGIKTKLEQFLLRPPTVFINRNADAIFSYGGVINDIIQRIGVPAENIITISGGIDDEWIADRPSVTEGKRKILFIGRNEKRKGLDDILAIEDRMINLPLEFHFVGPIPDDKQIEAPNMFYHGEIKDVIELRGIIDKCDVLIAPSHSEGMPNVILEAMARGLAIIASGVGAVPMMVDEENGILIKPRDRNALAEAIESVTEKSDQELSGMRQKSIQKVSEHFRWSAVANRTIEAIRKLTFTEH